jgi:signal recognition particle subunit SRP54
MTPAERSDPNLINIGRRRRIAKGAGVEEADVSGLVKQFDGMAAMMKQVASMSMIDRLKMMSGLGRAGAFNPGARIVAPKGNTGKRLSPKERAKQQKEREKQERKLRKEQREQRRQQPGA